MSKQLTRLATRSQRSSRDSAFFSRVRDLARGYVQSKRAARKIPRPAGKCAGPRGDLNRGRVRYIKNQKRFARDDNISVTLL